MLPRQIVPTRQRKSTPVGIEISSVVSMNGFASVGAHPVVNMWWAQTMMARPAMPSIAPTMAL